MPGMSNERMGEIALKLLVAKMVARGGFRLGSDMQRDLGRAAKETGIPREELNEFALALLPEFIRMAFNAQDATVTLSNPRPDDTE